MTLRRSMMESRGGVRQSLHDWLCPYPRILSLFLILPGCVAGLLALVPGCRDSADISTQTPVAAAARGPLAAVAGTPVHARGQAPPTGDTPRSVPDWIADAVFYQIFPERFRNGDRSNDPTHDSLEFPDLVPKSWAITPWTSDWYARAAWEREAGDNFYENGVFNRRYGGDLQGVLDKLNYLVDLGINTIYFNPVFYGRSLHKYDSTSMHHIDPYFGPDSAGDLELMAKETADPASWRWTAADRLFLKLLNEAHRRKIRIIIDGVFNHTGRDFFAFVDLRKQQQASPYKDWYIVQQYDDPQTPKNEFRYKGWWGVDTLPEFADAPGGHDLHDGPKQYVMNITRRWMDPNGDGDPSDGIDGWRLDVANELPVEFWHAWNTRVREINPEAYTVAEIWDNARHFLQAGHFSATMNYYGFAYPVKGYLIDGKLAASDFGRQLKARLQEYPPALRCALLNLIDSHDTDRLASMIVNAGRQPYVQPGRFDYDVSERVSPRSDDQYDVQGPDAAQVRIERMVALMQMTYVGAPMIYYGTEVGMWGADDPGDRQPMVWDDLTYDDQASDPLGRPRRADPVRPNQRLHQFYRAVIRLREHFPVLRKGTFRPIAHDDPALFFAFERQLGEEALLVAFNRGDKPYRWKVPGSDQQQVGQIFCASGEPDKILTEQDAGDPVVTIPALDGVVLARRPREE